MFELCLTVYAALIGLRRAAPRVVCSCVVKCLLLTGARAPAPIFDVEEDIADLDLESDIFGTPGDVKTLMVSDVGSSAWKAIKKTAGKSHTT